MWSSSLALFCHNLETLYQNKGFPDSSAGKESGSISEFERFAGEGIGYPLQYSWASLVAQLVKKLPEMWET